MSFNLAASSSPQPANLQSSTVNTWWTALGLTILAFVWRVVDLNRFATWDELFWSHAALRFWRAVQSGAWPRTYVIGQPGVVQMWLGSLAATVRGWLGGEAVWEASRAAGRPRYDPANLPMLGAVADEGRSFTPMTGLLTALAVGGVYLLARRLLGGRAALVGALLLIINPFYLAHSRVVALDAVLASLMLLSVLAWLVYRREGRLRFLLLSGVLGGLAALQKTTGVFVLGYVGLLCLIPVAQAVAARRWRDALVKGVVPFAGWAIVAAATYVVVWPAMWVTPVDTLANLMETLRAYAPAAHDPTFFLGEATVAPGPLFYPLVAVFRSSPLTLLGLALLAWRAVRRDRALPWPTVGALLLYAGLFGIALSLSAAKFERYLLPALLPLDLAAGVGLAAVFLGAYTRTTDHGPRTTTDTSSRNHPLGFGPSSFVGPLLLVALLLGQGLLVLSYHPYYLAWYNPLFGGQRAAQHSLPLGWGEGMEQAAQYLAAQPDAERLTVAAWGAVGLAPWFRGQVILPERRAPWRDADYAVVYVTDVQRGDDLAQAVAGRNPVFIGRVHDLDYVWVYRLRD